MRVLPIIALALLGCSAGSAPERRCNAHAQCDDGFMCGAEGYCIPSAACAHDTDCCPGAVCFSGWCRPTAECEVGGLPCPGLGEVCEAWPGLGIAGAPGALGAGALGLCVPAPCDALGGCPEPAACVAGRCLIGPPCDGRCGDGQVCEPASGRCLPAAPPPEVCTCDGGAPVATLRGASPVSCGAGSYGCACALLPMVPAGRPGVDGRLVPGDGALPSLVSYEPEYGDLVLSRFVDASGARIDTALDGVPAVPASAAGAYRGGVLEPGPDRGQRPAVAPPGGTGAYDILYRDADRQRVMFTRVGFDGARRAIGELPIDGLDVGRYLCLTRRGDGRLAGLVFVSRDLDDRVARLLGVESRASDPVSADDWSVTLVEETPLPPRSEAPCANACGLGEVCVLDGGSEVCGGVVDFGSGCGSCGAQEVCAEVNGQKGCRSRVYGRYDADRLPFGEGLYASCAARGDEVFAAWYDADEQRLVAGRWPLSPADRVVVDGPGIGAAGVRKDAGRFSSIALDGARIGIAYQDAAQATLLFAEAPSWGAAFSRETLPSASGGEPGVGARALYVNGAPVVVHLDGRESSVEVLAKGGGCWGRATVFGGIGFAYPDAMPDGAGGVWVSAQALVFDDALAPHHGPVLMQRALPGCQ